MKKLLALVLALVMSLSLVTISNAAFKDADKISHDEAVTVMNAVGVLVGDNNGNFNAKDNLTRAQAAKIVSYLLLGNKTAEALVGSNKFTDVAASNWAAGFIGYCASTNVVAGVGNGQFAPDGQLTGYQFAKMLLVALGYDAKIEGFVGNDWQINVSKRADQADLFDGLEINGNAALTREQAAQMALNTLKSPLIEYENKGGNLSVNGAEVNIGASNAEYKTTSTKLSEQTIFANQLNSSAGKYIVEFAEQYYPKLVLKSDQADSFGRPAHTWLLDNKKIGTYAEDVDYEYTTAVTGKALYETLGKNVVEGKDAYDFTIFVDGDVNNDLFKEIVKNNKDDIKLTGNGVLTQVFINNDKKTVTITLVNTYLAQAQSDYNTKKDNVKFNLFGKPAPVANAEVSGEDFNIADVKEDEFYLVTYSKDSKAIESVVKAEIVADTAIDSFKAGKGGNITVSGTKYEYDKTAAYDSAVLDEYTGIRPNVNLKDITYNLYLDQYGYVIGVEEVEAAKNYVFISGVDANGSYLTTKTYSANALFLDGTSKVIDVKNTTEFRTSVASPVKPALVNQWYTYTVSGNNVYTLTLVGNAAAISGSNKIAQYHEDRDAKEIDQKHIALAGTTAGTYTNVYGNDATVYLSAKIDKVTNDGTTYAVISGVDNVTTGVRNASLKTFDSAKVAANKGVAAVNAAGGVYALYKSNGYVIAAVVVGEDSYANKNLVYVNNDISSESFNKSTGKWTWTLKAIQDGEEVMLTETNDTGVSELKKMAATQNVWYVVKFYADGTVYEAKRASAELISDKYATNMNDAVQRVEDDKADTILLESVAKSTKDFKLIGNTLQDLTSNKQGLFVSDNVKVALIQKVDNKKTTTYETGVKALKNILDNLNDAKNINYQLSAVIEKGAVTSVVINDMGEDGFQYGIGQTYNFAAGNASVESTSRIGRTLYFTLKMTRGDHIPDGAKLTATGLKYLYNGVDLAAGSKVTKVDGTGVAPVPIAYTFSTAAVKEYTLSVEVELPALASLVGTVGNDITVDISEMALTADKVKLTVSGAEMSAYDKDISNTTSATVTTFTVDTAKYTVATQSSCTWTIAGATDATGKALKGTGIAALETQIKTTGIKVLGDQAVVITVTGLTPVPKTYSITGLGATTKDGIKVTTAVTGTDSNLKTDDMRVVKAQIDTLDSAKAVKVTLSIGGKEVTKTITAITTDEPFDTITITDKDVAVSVVSVEKIPAIGLASATWEGNKVNVVFTTKVNKTDAEKISAYTLGGTMPAGISLASAQLQADGKTVVLTFAGNDVAAALEITLDTSIKNAEVDTDKTTALMKVTLSAAGAATVANS